MRNAFQFLIVLLCGIVAALVILIGLSGCSAPSTCTSVDCSEADPGEDMSTSIKARGWSASGVIHTNATDTVSLQQVFPEAGNYTVQFAVNPPNSTTFLKPTAIIQWVVQGNTVTRQVDVGNGVSVTGVGESVKVVVQDVNGDPTHVAYGVSIVVAPGTRASTSLPPTLSGTNVTLGVGGSVSLPVPPAGVTSVEVAIAGVLTSSPTGVLVSQFNAATTVKEYDVLPDTTAGFVSLAPGAAEVSVANLDAAHSVNVTITWGIDG
jgi:hypothetical protein